MSNWLFHTISILPQKVSGSAFTLHPQANPSRSSSLAVKNCYLCDPLTPWAFPMTFLWVGMDIFWNDYQACHERSQFSDVMFFSSKERLGLHVAFTYLNHLSIFL